MENLLIDRRFYNEDCDYTHMLMESVYKLELISNENKFLRSLNAMVCIESGNNEALQLLVEAAGEGLKNFVTKLWNGIVKMWNTFVHKLEELVGAQKKFLDDNKSIILKKTPKKVSMSTYKYDLTKLQNTSIQKYNADKIKEIKDEDSFKDNLFASMKLQVSGEDAKELSVSDSIKRWIRGSSEPVTVLSTDLDFATMFNYCYDFKNIKNKIKLELDVLDTTKNDILTIAKVSSDQYDKDHENDNSEAKNESFYYGSIADIINEMEVQKDNSASGTSSSGSPTKGNNQMLSGQMSNTADKQKDVGTDKVKSDVNDMKEKGEDLEAIQEKINIYYKICGNVLSAKLNIASEIFKEYMQILRWHVDSFTNKEKKTTDIVGTPKGQDFSKTNQTIKEEQPE